MFSCGTSSTESGSQQSQTGGHEHQLPLFKVENSCHCPAEQQSPVLKLPDIRYERSRSVNRIQPGVDEQTRDNFVCCARMNAGAVASLFRDKSSRHVAQAKFCGAIKLIYPRSPLTVLQRTSYSKPMSYPAAPYVPLLLVPGVLTICRPPRIDMVIEHRPMVSRETSYRYLCSSRIHRRAWNQAIG
jgi:hypothetical protein